MTGYDGMFNKPQELHDAPEPGQTPSACEARYTVAGEPVLAGDTIELGQLFDVLEAGGVVVLTKPGAHCQLVVNGTPRPLGR